MGERLFRNSGLATGNPVKNPTEAAKKIKKKKSFKQLILGKSSDAAVQLPKVDETKEAEATSDDVKEIGKSEQVDDSSSPDLNMNNREKKKRKKRRHQRKNIDENEDSSSLSDSEPTGVRSATTGSPINTTGSIPELQKPEVQEDMKKGK